MFGFLKKKLQETVEKISSVVKKEEVPVEKIEEAMAEEKFKEEIKEEKKIIREAKKGKAVQIEERAEEKIEAVPEEKEKKPSLIEKIKKKISEKTLSEADLKDILWDLQIGLIENDVAVEVAEKICSDLKQSLIGKSVGRKEVEIAVKNSLKSSIMEILKINSVDLEAIKKPALVLLLGFNGSGKTTTLAKLAHKLKQSHSVVLAAGDTFRAAALEQVEEHGKRLEIKVIKQKYGSDSAAVIFDAKKYAESNKIDFVLADTAGRSHTNINLIEELKKVCRVNKPDLKLLIVDALTGNDVVEQAKVFDSAVGVDGIILTKADVYEKGGAVLSAAHSIKKPILFLGTGQNYEDLEEFDAEKIVENLLE